MITGAIRIVQIAALSILVWTSVSTALAEDDRLAAREKYAELAAKVRAGDLGVDWQALRVAAAIGEVGEESGGLLASQRAYGALN